MLRSLFRDNKAFRATLCLSLASAVVPAALCVAGLSYLREDVAKIDAATVQAQLSGDLVNTLGQTLFYITSAALDLSDDERVKVVRQTDENLDSLIASVVAAGSMTRQLLAAEEQRRLGEAIRSIMHSWRDVRGRPGEEMSAPEKAFHFLKIVDEAEVARDILFRLDRFATTAVDRAVFDSLKHTNDISLFLLLALTLGAFVSGAALIANFRIAEATRKANLDLETAVADLKERDEALQLQNERFDTALGNMSQGLVMFDAGQRLIVCNRRYCEIYGLAPETMKPGRTLRDLFDSLITLGQIAPQDAERAYADRQRLIAGRKPALGRRELTGGRIIQIVHRPMEGGGWVATHEDVTEREKTEAQIAYMAHHDALTGLANRVLFRKEMERALTRVHRGESFAVLCLDLDHFKAVNDTLGHPVGDGLLKEVGERLRGCVAEGDTIARLGGDEFAIVQVGVDQPRSATALAECIIANLGAPFTVDGHQVVVGASIGIAFAPDDNDDPDQLLKAADMALYRAKTDGRGTFRFFEPEMDAKMQSRRGLEVDLRRALAESEFEVHYQPLINIGENRVSGFEALLRWTHPERGLIAPTEFIPLAEEIGLINQIGGWVLRQACADAVRWPADVRLAVNLSPAQFRSRTLVLDVVAALGRSGLPAKRLELEITEAVMLEHTESTLAILHELRALGVRISMDDFGTGYSSLSYLRKFPFDKIKIDQSFIREMTTQDECAAIVRAVAGLGASLGMSTTAEGVETQEQLDKLRHEGCTEVQGWLFSAARPASELPALMVSLAERCRAAA